MFRSSTLKIVLGSFRRRVLLYGVATWRRRLFHHSHHEEPQAFLSKKLHHREEPRKAHCRCVYAISRGQRCTCEPRTHLLRRLEALHELVEQGLAGRRGGHLNQSHAVQGIARSNARDCPLTSGCGVSRAEPTEPQGMPGEVEGHDADLNRATYSDSCVRSQYAVTTTAPGFGCCSQLNEECPDGFDSIAASTAGLRYALYISRYYSV